MATKPKNVNSAGSGGAREVSRLAGAEPSARARTRKPCAAIASAAVKSADGADSLSRPHIARTRSGAPFTKTRIARRYASGLNDYEGIPIHVSPGVGMERGTAPQIRFLCPPEVSVLDAVY